MLVYAVTVEGWHRRRVLRRLRASRRGGREPSPRFRPPRSYSAREQRKPVLTDDNDEAAGSSTGLFNQERSSASQPIAMFA